VNELVAHLELPADELLYDAVARCNAALESCLEAQREREAREREDPIAALRDELTRLAQLLAADRSDAVLVMRQIRRVLGRFDAGHKR
jgi:ribosomal protein L29